MLILTFLLATSLLAIVTGTSALKIGSRPSPPSVWGPTAQFYWRCQPPYILEVSDNRRTWFPSSVCLEGTCCSDLAGGPVCTREACSLGRKE